ncbi:PIR protein [Plasmodium ovale]|uniref:PIR Superfamily Protein n=2 Tax=Plasmodium ovale TaxID=36330 RepID=A0A1A8WHF1_PLAOA|nr:PIR Superfamily Protein [Plasmodium ovale curtisi]SBT82946.1 PIR protein [Plasmodium ovale]
MPCEKQTDKYKFCINSNYYETIVQYVKGKSGEIEKEKNCDDIILDVKFNKNVTAKDICQEFKFLYKSFSTYPYEEILKNEPFSYYDCDFLNYWLNDKLRDNVNNGSIRIKEFYEEIKNKDGGFFSKIDELEKYLHVIDPSVLENMKLLYNLYDNAVKIMSIISNKECTNEEQKSCIDYIKECDKKYKEAMDKCFNSNDDFYNALKYFKDSYKIITEPSFNESNACNSSVFLFFPEYDPVPEKEKEKEKRIMTIKISSTLSVLSLVLPLIYKYTPFGPFLRTKINMVKDRWMNPDKNGDELLPLSTGIEDIISDNDKYNIGYYSETN